MAEVAEERAIASTPEADALVEAICKAISDYWDYLDRTGLIYDDRRDLMRASALHAKRWMQLRSYSEGRPNRSPILPVLKCSTGIPPSTRELF
jgi:hypothetical protein